MKKQKHLLKIRTQLLKRLSELEQATNNIKEELIESAENQTNFLRDCLDHAKEQTEIGSRLEIYNRYLKEQNGIHAAICRINNGKFGECMECGDEISEHRLTVQPSASLCIECQSLKEAYKGPEAASVRELSQPRFSFLSLTPEVA